MGLAAPKNRIKLSHDPNNTKWTKDTQSFGHKIMASQGWQPGDHLGVKGAAHAELHTDANFSHIRVTIKDDNLGLGAKIGSGVGPGECTGLDAFQNLLGRLNGRDEDEIEKEQKSRDDLKRAIYAEQKWGTIRFVKGGLLVGDKIQTLIDDEKERVRKLNGGDSSSDTDSSEEESEEEASIVKEKTSKKRKLQEIEETVPEVVAVKVKKSKKLKIEQEGETTDTKVKKSKKRKVESSSASENEVTETLKAIKLSKKDKRPKKNAPLNDESDTTEDEELRRIRKEEKKQRKEEKRIKKEQARISEIESSKDSNSKSKKDKKKKDKEKSSSKDSSKVTTKESTPVVGSGTSTPVMGGRHAVRARNIAQKRLAAMDVASLNQIFMIKS